MTATLTPEARNRPCPTQRPPKVRRRDVGDAARSSTRRSSGRRRSSALRKLDPRTMARNPVMFIVEVGSVLTTILFVRDFGSTATTRRTCSPASSRVWLWFTVLFANFAEAMAEGRGKAQADALRKTRADTTARVRRPDGIDRGAGRRRSCRSATCASSPPAR